MMMMMMEMMIVQGDCMVKILKMRQGSNRERVAG